MFDLERMQLEGQMLSKFGFQISKYGKVLICNVEEIYKEAFRFIILWIAFGFEFCSFFPTRFLWPPFLNGLYH
jgi:hypothetical protein